MTLRESTWIKCPHPLPNASMRIICVPYAGGGASVFRHWHKAISDDVEICSVQLPGRENRFLEPAIDRIQPLIDELFWAILPLINDKPYALFGHSLGALICFELTRKVRSKGLAHPSHLFVSAREAPQLTPTRPPIHNLPEDKFIEAIESYGGTPESVLKSPELRPILLTLLRADLAINETYDYTHDLPFDIPISAFAGLQDPLIKLDSVDSWKAQTSGAFQLRIVQGNHFFMRDAYEKMLAYMKVDLALGAGRSLEVV